jgi:hypothetical protein
MRISGLLLVLLCGLASVCGANDSMRQSSSSQTAVNSFSSGLFSNSGIVRPDLLAASDRADRDFARSDAERDGNVTCYTIENFQVKRESSHSDVVEPAGYSTCLSASKYSVKKAEELGKARSRLDSR